MEALWSRNSQLQVRSRFEWHRQLGAHRTGELALLISLGALAAILTCIAASPIRLPGHAILRGTLPMILGLSLAPRHAAGALMSIAAAGVFAIANVFSLPHAPIAAAVAIIALGPRSTSPPPASPPPAGASTPASPPRASSPTWWRSPFASPSAPRRPTERPAPACSRPGRLHSPASPRSAPSPDSSAASSGSARNRAKWTRATHDLYRPRRH